MFERAMRAGLLSFAIAACFANAAQAAELTKPGDPAPRLIGNTLTGERFDLAALHGRIAVVNLWATWCPPCRAEMPALDAFFKTHRDQGVVVIGVSADRARDEDDVRRAMAPLSYPALLLSKAMVNGLGAPGPLPETIIIDRNGIVHDVIAPKNGAGVTTAELDAAIAPLLGGAASP